MGRRRGAAAPGRRSTVVVPPRRPAPGGVAEVRVPAIGDFKDVPVIEITVKPGDVVKPRRSARHARIR
jgi:pyruvate dehydrogenase E2 component (dihydrolipoamide acetyltransferase)